MREFKLDKVRYVSIATPIVAMGNNLDEAIANAKAGQFRFDGNDRHGKPLEQGVTKRGLLIVQPRKKVDPIESPWDEPQWDKAGKVHDWRNYIIQEVRDIWGTFTSEQQKVLYKQADDIAMQEEWD